MRRKNGAFASAAMLAAVGGTAAGLYLVRRLLGSVSRPSVDLNNKVVLITGGSRGLGLAMALEFARAGSRIAICARDADELRVAEERISAVAREVARFSCDVTQPKQTASLIEQVIQRFGRLDILINNAGEMKVAPVESLERADFESAMATMFWGPVDLTRGALPHMRRLGKAQIVNITSIGGRISVPRLIPYCCAKSALVAFSEGLAAELAPAGIRVLTVVPGLMRTGSYLQAQFKGSAEDEFAWFGLAANLPGFTVAADHAARQIRKSLERGDYVCTISWPAKCLAAMQGLAPELTRDLMAQVNEHILPKPKGTKTFVSGKVLDKSFRGVFRLFTTLGRTAAAELNQ